jgi:holliday junction DNA helicase RuvB
MARDKLIDGGSSEGDDRDFFEKLRPQRLGEMVGQKDVVSRLRISIDAAKKRGEPLPHLLLDGPPGLGKTTFATVLPHELGVDVQITSGPALTTQKDLIPYLTNTAEGSVLFIDEIHRMPRGVEEFIYPAMEDFRIDFVIGEGIGARTINMPLKRFTLIGATTRPGLLSAPLRERFLMHEHLEFYTTEELGEIVRINASKLKTIVTDEASFELARRSRGTPRLANARLRWVRDYATSKADGHVTLEIARRALEMAEIDEEGLDRQDRRYLTTLVQVFGGGPAGVEAIAATLNVSSDTLSDEVEPYLLRRGFIVRTSRGRQVTPDGYRLMNLSPPKDGQPRLF